MTGLRDEIDGQRCIIEKLIPAISKIKVIDSSKWALQPYQTKLNFINYNIVLINSDFDVKFKIDRAKLYDILVNDYKFYASYEPCIYPGINSKFYWNTSYFDEPYEGVCYCTKTCKGKGCGTGNGNCKRITIAIFQSGRILITGGRNREQITKSYNFINRVLKENFDIVRNRKVKLPPLDSDSESDSSSESESESESE